jgi:hypothetical protein
MNEALEQMRQEYNRRGAQPDYMITLQHLAPLAIAEELHRIADLMEKATDEKIEAAVEAALKKALL